MQATWDDSSATPYAPALVHRSVGYTRSISPRKTDSISIHLFSLPFHWLPRLLHSPPRVRPPWRTPQPSQFRLALNSRLHFNHQKCNLFIIRFLLRVKHPITCSWRLRTPTFLFLVLFLVKHCLRDASFRIGICFIPRTRKCSRILSSNFAISASSVILNFIK